MFNRTMLKVWCCTRPVAFNTLTTLFTVNEAINTFKTVNIWSHDYVSHMELRDLKGCIVIIIIKLTKFGNEL